MIKLIVTDLDGTVVGTSGVISDRVMAAFRACQAAGIGLCVATGRVRQALMPIGQDWSICHGGTLMFDRDYNCLFRSELSADEARAVHRWAAARGAAGYWFGENAWHSTDLAENYARTARFLGVSPAQAIDWPVPLVSMKVPAPDAAQAFPDLHVLPEGSEWSYFLKSACDKGTGLRMLMERLGLTPDEVMCFGDELNDLPMFRVAGHPVAVGNAKDELKAAAVRVAPPVSEDGVAIVLEELLQAAG